MFRQRYFFEGEPVTEGGPLDLGWFGTDGELLSGDQWHASETREIGMYLSGHLRSRTWDGRPKSDSSFLLLMNAKNSATQFVLPSQPYGQLYRRIFDTAQDIPTLATTEDSAGDTVDLPPFGCILLEVTKR